MLPVHEVVTEQVGRRLGIPTELTGETSYESCVEDRYEVCFVCSLPYVTFERQGLSPAQPVAAPVLRGDRYGGRPIYFSDVIVRAEAPFRSFLDLRGASWAYNESLSHSGYGITRYQLLRIGETDGFFSEIIESGFHEESIRLVADGEVDASAIDSQVLEVAMLRDPSLAESLRVIESLGPSTIQPVAVSKRVPPDLRRQVLKVLLSLADDAAIRDLLAVGLVERFVPVEPRDYDDIRRMLDACEAAGFMELR